jgi:hypothetical protein
MDLNAPEHCQINYTGRTLKPKDEEKGSFCCLRMERLISDAHGVRGLKTSVLEDTSALQIDARCTGIATPAWTAG